ncbi:MAG: magnesium transporter [Deltaproteobacteria bacterium]|nr:magnesium transporter [Deltaproteobacteria bacterium]
MEQTVALILPDLIEALRTDPAAVAELTEEMHPADLAEACSATEDLGLQLIFVKALGVDDAVRLVEHLDERLRATIVHELAKTDIGRTARIVDNLAADERALLFRDLEEDTRTTLFARMEKKQAADVKRLLAYPEDTAGGLMTTDFVALDHEMTVAKAIEHIRRVAMDMETIYEAYVVDENQTLVGAISLRDLVTSPADVPVTKVMTANVISLRAEAVQEEVARVIAKYDLLALPVTDRGRRILGVITVDDAVDVIAEEAAEDVQKMGAVSPIQTPYLETPFWVFVKKRVGWLIALFLGELFTGTVMRYYVGEEAGGSVTATIAMVWYVPLIISSGGNAGSQSAALVIQALALGEVQFKQVLRVIAREFAIGVVLGIILGVVGIIRVSAFGNPIGMHLTMTVAVGILAVVTMGATVGAALPMVIKRIGLDPAVSSTPFIASFVDVVGLVVYFSVGHMFLHLS